MASRVDSLADAYARHVALPWDQGLAPAQRVWFAVYPKEEERRLRYKIEAFQLVAPKAQPVTLPKATLHDETEVQTWLDEARAAILAKLADGPVVV